MAAVLADASYYRGGFSPCLAGSARRVMVPGGSTFHLEPGTIFLNLVICNNMFIFGGTYWLQIKGIAMGTNPEVWYANFVMGYHEKHILFPKFEKYHPPPSPC